VEGNIHRLVRVTAYGYSIFQEIAPKMSAPNMDLGIRPNPNLHRAHSGPIRVRIEAWQ